MKQQTQWPNLTRDQQAWQQAKAELGAQATFSQIALRAQEIKERL